MALHFSSPSGTLCGGVPCGCAPCSGASPRYEPGTATVGLLYLGPTVQPRLRRAAAISNTTQRFMLIALGWYGFGSSEPLALLARTGPLLDEIKDRRNEENADKARSQ